MQQKMEIDMVKMRYLTAEINRGKSRQKQLKLPLYQYYQCSPVQNQGCQKVFHLQKRNRTTALLHPHGIRGKLIGNVS